MKAFAIDGDAHRRIAAGLIGDTLRNDFGRYVDFMTVASWDGATVLGDGGIGLSEGEEAACARRIERFYGLGDGRLGPARQIDEWSRETQSAAMRKLKATAQGGAGLQFADLFADAAHIANLLMGRRRFLVYAPPHESLEFAATILAPALLDIPIVDVRLETPREISRLLQFGDALLAATPMWRYLIASGLAAPRNVVGVLFGEVASAEFASDMRKAGFAAVRELYGVDGAGCAAWRDSFAEPFVLFSRWRRDGSGLSRRLAAGGDLSVAPAESLHWAGERAFAAVEDARIVRRSAGRIDPCAMSEALAGHPMVEASRVSLAREASGERRLTAAIRLKPGCQPNEETARAISQWCRARLRPGELPHVYSFVAELKGD